MIFEQIRCGGCLSYVIGCEETRAAILVDPELELRADRELPDPTTRILTYCQLGKISTLAAQTLRTMGYARTVALDGGLDAWTQAGYALAKDS